MKISVICWIYCTFKYRSYKRGCFLLFTKMFDAVTNFLTAVFRKPAFIIAMPEYDFFFVLKEGNFIHYGCLDVLFYRDRIELLVWLTCPALNFTGNYYERGWTLSVFILWRKWLSECWPQVSNVKVICVAHIFCASPCV